MSLTQLLWATVIAAAFVAWPIIGKYSGASGAWVNSLVITGTFVSGLAISLRPMLATGLPSIKGIVVLLAAGAINGVAVYFYSVKTTDDQIPIGPFIMVMIIMMLVLTPLLGYAINDEAISERQWLGLLAAILTVWLLAG